MKGIVVDVKGKYAVILDKNGRFTKVKNNGRLRIGYEVDMPSPAHLDISTLMRKASIAAAFVLVIGLSAGVYSYNSPYAYIGIDINPSIEIATNIYDRIIRAEGLNDDGTKIAGLSACMNKKLKDGIGKIIDVAVEEGYLKKDASNTIVFTVSGKSEKKVESIEKEINSTVEEEIKAKNVDSEIVIKKTVLQRNKNADKNVDKKDANKSSKEAAGKNEGKNKNSVNGNAGNNRQEGGGGVDKNTGDGRISGGIRQTEDVKKLREDGKISEGRIARTTEKNKEDKEGEKNKEAKKTEKDKEARKAGENKKDKVSGAAGKTRKVERDKASKENKEIRTNGESKANGGTDKERMGKDKDRKYDRYYINDKYEENDKNTIKVEKIKVAKEDNKDAERAEKGQKTGKVQARKGNSIDGKNGSRKDNYKMIREDNGSNSGNSSRMLNWALKG